MGNVLRWELCKISLILKLPDHDNLHTIAQSVKRYRLKQLNYKRSQKVYYDLKSDTEKDNAQLDLDYEWGNLGQDIKDIVKMLHQDEDDEEGGGNK